MKVCCELGKYVHLMTPTELLGCNHDHCSGMVELKRTFTQQEREHILTEYKKYVDKVSEELEDKGEFSVEEVVEKIINIIEGMR